METIMECENLTKRYQSLVALNNVSFALPKGRIVGLLGPNGSGKTTLIKLAAGLLTPTKGKVTIGSEPIGPKTKAEVAYLSERLYLPNWMKVSDCLEYFSDFYADFDKVRAVQMLLNLEVPLETAIKNLSKGTREKMQLVLVMSRRAKLYLLDEPIGGVDPATRDYILSTIIKNYDDEATILLSTHLIADVEKILDDFIFLKNGSVVMFDSADNARTKEGKSIDELFREVFRCSAN